MTSILRCPSVLLAVVMVGCTGGQTGEITEEGHCDEVVEEIALGALLPASQARLEELTRPITATAYWVDSGSETLLALDVSTTGERARLVGPGTCGKALRIDAVIRGTTEDGRLDVELPGVIEMTDVSIFVQGGQVVSSLGSDPLPAPQEVSLWMESNPPSARGEIALGEVPIATF